MGYWLKGYLKLKQGSSTECWWKDDQQERRKICV